MIKKEQLRFCPGQILRQKVARRYTNFLASCSKRHAPFIPAGYLSAWAQYSVLAESGSHGAALQQNLQDSGIPTAIFYPKPLHLQAAFAALRYKAAAFPVSEDYATRIFSLPIYPYLQEAEQERIAGLLCSL